MKKVALILGIVFYSSFGLCQSGEESRTQQIQKEFKDKNVSIEASSRMVLGQYLEDKKAKANSYYTVTFICRHKKNKNDTCELTDVNYRK